MSISEGPGRQGSGQGSHPGQGIPTLPWKWDFPAACGGDACREVVNREPSLCPLPGGVSKHGALFPQACLCPSPPHPPPVDGAGDMKAASPKLCWPH